MLLGNKCTQLYKTRFPLNRRLQTTGEQNTQTRFMLMWPWPWPDDLDVQLGLFWRCTSTPKMNFVCQGCQQL